MISKPRFYLYVFPSIKSKDWLDDEEFEARLKEEPGVFQKFCKSCFNKNIGKSHVKSWMRAKKNNPFSVDEYNAVNDAITTIRQKPWRYRKGDTTSAVANPLPGRGFDERYTRKNAIGSMKNPNRHKTRNVKGTNG